MFTPKIGKMIQDDLRMFFNWVGFNHQNYSHQLPTNERDESKRHSHRQGVDVAVGAGGMAGMAMWLDDLATFNLEKFCTTWDVFLRNPYPANFPVSNSAKRSGVSYRGNTRGFTTQIMYYRGYSLSYDKLSGFLSTNRY